MGLPQSDITAYEHPIELVEHLIAQNCWEYDRISQDEIVIQIDGACANYEITFCWLPKPEVLHVICTFDNYVLPSRHQEMRRLIAMINSKVLLGNFDFWANSHVIVFRQTLPLAGGLQPSISQIEFLISTVIETCDSNNNSCRLIEMSGLPDEEALKCCLFETKGSA